MVYLKKVRLNVLPDGGINLVPLDEIADVKIIIPDDKLGVWVFVQSIPGVPFNGPTSNQKVRDLNNEDIETITNNGGTCYVEVNYFQKLSMPSSGLDKKKVVLHLSNAEI
jgi:hypothetical protein